MTRKEIEQRHQNTCELICTQKLKSAIEELESLFRLTTKPDYYYQLEIYSENYKTLLRYAFDGYDDPQQQQILDGLSASMLSMADDIRQTLLDNELQGKRIEKRLLMSLFGDDPQIITGRIEELFFHREVKKLIEETDREPIRQLDQIFKLIWLTGKLTDDHIKLIQQINRSDQIEWHEKCLVVSALTLSILNQFDQNKIFLLLEFVETRENQVFQRALTGLILGLLLYDKRLAFYPEIVEKLKKVSADESIIPEIELILMQLLMARETDKITREFEEEVLPEMKKMMPKIEDKLQLTDLTEDEEMEGKNPGWKEIIGEVPGLFEKIEKFSKMQMEGGDVFMSTFQMLKRFDFFNAMSNWFVPFHRDHPEIKSSFSDNEEINTRLLESLEKAFYICNSDKYSFAINFRAIPDQQRTMIVANFEAEFAQMTEMATEEQILDKSLLNNSVFIQYIQDLYRFYKLFPTKQEFDDIFQRRIRVNSLFFYKTFFERAGFTEKLASFHFENDHYNDAIEEYEGLMEKNGPANEYFEKIGYCYQKIRRYDKAVEYYKKAELFDSDRPWILKKLGYCSLKLKDYAQALGYFKDASTLHPDDVSLQIQVGQCYLNLKDYDQALHQYAKLRFFVPDNLKILRPIAYCQFVLGKHDLAAELYAQILSLTSTPTAYDLMNAAHVRLCLGQRKEALHLYRQSLLQNSPGRNALMEAFDEDSEFLVKNGIPAREIPLIRDFLMFQTEA
ncbi:MAG: tetratricopeptide repeat protein [Bacteroidales bacterium]|nr:tetratricopeptide repeat protein [Bacteroidales bacterium]